jgi:hypothetical protein
MIKKTFKSEVALLTVLVSNSVFRIHLPAGYVFVKILYLIKWKNKFDLSNIWIKFKRSTFQELGNLLHEQTVQRGQVLEAGRDAWNRRRLLHPLYFNYILYPKYNLFVFILS